MSTAATTTTTTGPAVVTADLYRLTVDEYEAMAAAGILADPRVELVDGLLVRKMTKKPAHSAAAGAVAEGLWGLVPPGWYVRVEQPLRLPDFDEPEPDVAVVRGRPADYRGRHPGPEDVALVVEVSDSSLARDRGEKLAAYGRSGVAVYWIVNLADRQVELYMDPDPIRGGYGRRVVHDASSAVPVVVDGVERGAVAAAELVG